jgi:hypothetical protein
MVEAASIPNVLRVYGGSYLMHEQLTKQSSSTANDPETQKMTVDNGDDNNILVMQYCNQGTLKKAYSKDIFGNDSSKLKHLIHVCYRPKFDHLW